MRAAFFEELYRMMLEHPEIMLIISDNGAIVADDLRRDLKKRYINVGTSEQNMIGVAAGMALMGKVVYVFTMVPFATMRCYEQIRVDAALHNANVKIIGVGPGVDYSTLGPTHHGYEDIALMRQLPNMSVYSPSDDIMARAIVNMTYSRKGPVYIRLDRNGQPLVYEKRKIDLDAGFNILNVGEDTCFITTGRMIHTGLQLVEHFKKSRKNPGLVDLFKIKPFNAESLIEILKGYKTIVTIEEHFVTGGIGSLVADLIAENGVSAKLVKFGIKDVFYYQTGPRDYAYKVLGIDFESIRDVLESGKILN